MENLTWWRISSDLVLTKHNQPNTKLGNETIYWLNLIDSGKIYETSFGNKHILYHYKIYDGWVNEFKIKEQNLECNYIYECRENVFGGTLAMEIKDSQGIAETHYFGSLSLSIGKSHEEAIIDGTIFMKENGSLHSWEAISLQVELNKAQEEINIIWDRMKSAEDELMVLKKHIDNKTSS